MKADNIEEVLKYKQEDLAALVRKRDHHYEEAQYLDRLIETLLNEINSLTAAKKLVGEYQPKSVYDRT